MLKGLRIHYFVDFKDHPALIRKTFNKLVQKFGAVSIFAVHVEQNLNLLEDMVDLCRMLNVKFIFNTSSASIQALIKIDEARVIALLEHIDIVGITNQTIEAFAEVTEIIKPYVHHLEYVLLSPLMFGSVEHFDQVILYKSLGNFSDSDIDQILQEHPGISINEADVAVDLNGQIKIAGVNLAHVNQNSKSITQVLLKHSAYVQKHVQAAKSFPYQIDAKFLLDAYHKVTSGRALFFDIEAVSKKSTNVDKHHINDFPIPILYAGIKIEPKQLRVAEKVSFTVKGHEDLLSIYNHFFKYVKTNQIEYLVVSGGVLEKRFIENMVYYLRDQLSLEDVRYLFRLKEQMIDIQLVLDKRHNSNKVLAELGEIFPDLATYFRRSDKLSIKINFILDGLIFGPKTNLPMLNRIIDYCFEDVYADFELFRLYCHLDDYHLIEG